MGFVRHIQCERPFIQQKGGGFYTIRPLILWPSYCGLYHMGLGLSKVFSPYTPPPLTPFCPEGIFRGGGEIWSPPQQEFYRPPLFYPPPLEDFQGWGGGIKFGSVFSTSVAVVQWFPIEKNDGGGGLWITARSTECFEDFSCFLSQESETTKNSPKIPASFQCQIRRQMRKIYSRNFSGEEAT